ncbi:conjugal transfer protein TraX [Variovorax paradoxus]|nr:TraX family protein [Variovorax paradoxus]MBT2305307.1 conjugal transfer protein TraX [Variovorax paradoxus]
MAKVLSAKKSTVAVGGAEPFVVAHGTLEALKWLALGLMALDHANKYLFNEGAALLYDLGRMAMPLFGFVLMYNLARPGALEAGMHLKVMRRLLVFGALATPAFVALVGWWPLNILFMLLLATGIISLVEAGGALRTAGAAMAFILGGAVVEFWWFGVLSCLGAWAFCRKPTMVRLVLWISAIASLWVVNRNFAALACLPLIWAASRVDIPLRRHRWAFYGLYPAHLTIIWLVLQMP